MTKSTIEKCLHLRLLVGYLGEAPQYGWWSTSFFQPTSRIFLEPVFARTHRKAQYHGVREAARSLHDNRVGLGKVFHLFRLPEEVERDLHKLIEEPNRVEPLFAALTSQQDALAALTILADGSAEIAEGPVNIGKVKEVLNNKSLKEIARYYVAAFNQGVQTYPYLLVDRATE